jgi:uncharacterized protein YyaL (SSP411 family)
VANHLADETSPYLLQHKDNPVAWEPWGERALKRARDEDKPLLVSIGYSSCHWCHVMERESFEDADIAAYMNEHFVCIKVDREERPDVDAIYMEAAQAMTGQGGWPLNVFCTPDQAPFYAGTYFPPVPAQGMPSWRQLLEAIVEAWTERREEIRDGAPRLVERLQGAALLQPSNEIMDARMLDEAAAKLRQAFDPRNGGFGHAPKFPQASALEFMLRRGDLEVVDKSLRAMASGGIYDQVGGGFARYSVDAQWLVPHFEKMLYDNALLARVYLHAWQVTAEPLFRRVCEETLGWALREMRGAEGGFYSALDADSEGVEGKFYVWSLDEVRAIAGDEAADWFGATAAGNFEGANILTRGEGDPEKLGEWRCKLYGVREKRVWPGLDDKRLCSWNALMISALADAGAVFANAQYLEAASKCADFVLTQMRDGDGRLLRTWKDGVGHLNAYLEDHAYLVEALLTLYEATWEPRWFSEARALADTMIARFADDERGGFFDTSTDHERLVTRRKSLEDNPIPSGNSSAAYGLLRLAALTGERDYEQRAVGVFRLLHEIAARHPQAFPHLLEALDFYFAPVKEVAIVGPDADALARVVRDHFRPHIVVAGWPAADSPAADATAAGATAAAATAAEAIPLLRDRDPVDGRTAAYVCERFACQRPVTEPAELEELLAAA